MLANIKNSTIQDGTCGNGARPGQCLEELNFKPRCSEIPAESHQQLAPAEMA